MNTPGSVAWSCMRTRSPRIAPPLNGLVGSTASTPTVEVVARGCTRRGVGERRLPRAGRAGDPDRPRLAGVRMQRGDDRARVVAARFDERDAASRPRPRSPRRARSTSSAAATAGDAPGSYSSVTTSVTPGTRSMMIRSTPALSVIIDTGQVPQAPTSVTCTTPSSSSAWKMMSPPSLWRAGRIASIASRMSFFHCRPCRAPCRFLRRDRCPTGVNTSPVSQVVPGRARLPGVGAAESGTAQSRRSTSAPEGPQRGRQVGVAPVDVLAVVDDGLAVGDEAGEHEGGAGPHVGRRHRRAREALDAAHDRRGGPRCARRHPSGRARRRTGSGRRRCSR